MKISGIKYSISSSPSSDRARQARHICSTDLDLPTRAPRAREVVHRSFEDPAAASGPEEEEQLEAFRRVRDEMKGWIT